MDLPDGFVEINDYATYRISAETKILTGCCGLRHVKDSWIGLSRQEFIYETSCNPVVFCIKGKSKPLFKTDKPYPWGY